MTMHQRMRAEKDFPALAEYWASFNAHLVETVLGRYRACVFDFGTGHSVYNDTALFGRV